MKAPPNRTSVQGENGFIAPAWQEYFTSIFQAVSAIQSSGVTANRPLKGLYIGRPYFDTTLGYVVHYDGVNWVNGDGTTV